MIYLIRNLLTLSCKNDGHNQTIDTQDTSHNNWYDGFEDQFWLEDTHRRDTDTTLSSTVSSTEIYEKSLVWVENLLQKTRAQAIPMYPKKVA